MQIDMERVDPELILNSIWTVSSLLSRLRICLTITAYTGSGGEVARGDIIVTIGTVPNLKRNVP